VLDIAKFEPGEFTLNTAEYAIESVVETVRSATCLWMSLAQNKMPAFRTTFLAAAPRATSAYKGVGTLGSEWQSFIGRDELFQKNRTPRVCRTHRVVVISAHCGTDDCDDTAESRMRSTRPHRPV
jgi:hypothetical protein